MLKDLAFAIQVGLLLAVLVICVGAIVRGFLRDVEREQQRRLRHQYRYHEIL